MHKSAMALSLLVLFSSSLILSTQHHFIFSVISENIGKIVLHEFITESTIEIDHDGNKISIEYIDKISRILHKAEYQNHNNPTRLINSIEPSNTIPDTSLDNNKQLMLTALCKAVQEQYFKMPIFLC